MTNLRVWVWDDDLGVVYADAKTLREAYNIIGLSKGVVTLYSLLG